jgi:hypothetical protein
MSQNENKADYNLKNLPIILNNVVSNISNVYVRPNDLKLLYIILLWDYISNYNINNTEKQVEESKENDLEKKFEKILEEKLKNITEKMDKLLSSDKSEKIVEKAMNNNVLSNLENIDLEIVDYKNIIFDKDRLLNIIKLFYNKKYYTHFLGIFND